MIARIVALIAWLFVAFQVYTAGYAPMTAIFQRSIHLGFVLVLLFLTVPVSKRFPPWLRWLLDGALIAATLVAVGYIYTNYDEIMDRFGWWELTDVWLGVVATL